MNFLVTGGGTVAPIDDVRQISNASTGRFSSEISEAALRRGGRVWHLHAPGARTPLRRLASFDLDADPDREAARLRALKDEWDARRGALTLCPLRVGTVEDYAAALRSILLAEPIDVVFLAMAASDYAPVPSDGKLSSDADELILRCRRLPKVIHSVRDWAPDVYLVGFKLLSGVSEEELIARARSSGASNRADLTVANDARLLRAGRHTVHLIDAAGPTETIGPGGDIAGALVDRVIGLAARRGQR